MPQIRDIKPIVDIPDFSIYLALFFAGIILIALIVFLYNLIYKFFHDRKRMLKKAVFKKLKEVDFENPKRAAYDITRYGRYLICDDKSQKIYDELILLLEKYKYKKEIDDKIARRVIRYYYLFIEAVDE